MTTASSPGVLVSDAVWCKGLRLGSSRSCWRVWAEPTVADPACYPSPLPVPGLLWATWLWRQPHLPTGLANWGSTATDHSRSPQQPGNSWKTGVPWNGTRSTGRGGNEWTFIHLSGNRITQKYPESITFCKDLRRPSYKLPNKVGCSKNLGFFFFPKQPKCLWVPSLHSPATLKIICWYRPGLERTAGAGKQLACWEDGSGVIYFQGLDILGYCCCYMCAINHILKYLANRVLFFLKNIFKFSFKWMACFLKLNLRVLLRDTTIRNCQ